MNEELLELEDRIRDLEFKQLKMSNGWTRTQITATSTAATSKRVPLEMRVSRRGGATKYELRSASGWTPLPADRKLWPVEARKMQDEFDEYDKRRRVGGRLISAACGTAGIA